MTGSGRAPTFTPFWDALSELGIPVFFTLYSTNYAEYLEELRTLGRWMERYPDVTVVQTHGFNWRMFADEEKLHVPDEVYDAAPIDNPNYHIQLLFAVFLQRRWDYPIPQILPTMEKMYRPHRPGKADLGNRHTRLPPLVDVPPEPRLPPQLLRLHPPVRHGPHPRWKHGANHGRGDF